MSLKPSELRARCRSGEHTTHTSGCCLGYKQAKNAAACPLLAVSRTGQLSCPELAVESDIRTDLPRYRVYRNGTLIDEPTEITYLFDENESVVFYIGCSFSFERILADNGVPVRNVLQGKNVPMFITNRKCEAVGPFQSYLVVTYRPIPADKVELAKELSEKVHLCHGAPIHCGDPSEIGIGDLSNPDFGDALDPYESSENDIPCFWACGVTAILASAVNSRLPLVMTHAPGCMFVSDVPDDV